MRLVILALGLLAASCSRDVPDMTCKAKGEVMGMQAGQTLHRIDDASDVFRITNGKLYHRYSGREEYLYGDIKEGDLGRYVSGHMVFVMDDNNRSGYVVIAGPGVWKVTYLDCQS
jgi:hypothetical protein